MNGKKVISKVIEFKVIFLIEEIVECFYIEMEILIYDIFCVWLVKDELYVLEYMYMLVGVILGIN